MTRISTHHPRSGWQKDEIDLLFDSVRTADAEGRSLRDVFNDVGRQLQRKPNSIRNYYYAKLREMPELSQKQTPFRAFSPEEVHDLLRQVLMGRGSGESVRACVTRLAEGDRSRMLRYQNKYRSILKNKPDTLLAVAEELRAEGLPCPENVVEYRRYGAPAQENPAMMIADDYASLPAYTRLMQALNDLLNEMQSACGPARVPTEEGLWYARWEEARQEADRLRVEVDLLKIALEDAREGRESTFLCGEVPNN